MMHFKAYVSIVILSIFIVENISGKSVANFKCPPRLPEVNCLIDPCSNATCPGDPDAVCLAIYCGRCTGVWLKLTGEIADCEDKKCGCPPGQNQVQCIQDPCDGETCPGDPNAKCFSNYCGGCNAVWVTAENELAECYNTTKCPDGQNKVQCIGDPCQGEICSEYPDAKCVSNYCGGYNFDWFLSNGTKVQCGNKS